jgi:hypothetical protein
LVMVQSKFLRSPPQVAPALRGRLACFERLLPPNLPPPSGSKGSKPCCQWCSSAPLHSPTGVATLPQ